MKRSFYLLNSSTVLFYSITERRVIDGFSLSPQKHVRKGNDAKNP